MNTNPFLCALAVPFLQSATAATLAVPGSDLNQPSWRTSSVIKPLDGDGDNVYGTAGYFMPRFGLATGSTVAFSTADGTNNTLNTLPSYFTVTTSGGATGANSMYPQKTLIDNPNDVSGPDVNSGIAFHGTARAAGYGDFFNFTIGAGVPVGTLRIGIMTGNSGGGDRVDGLRLTQTAGTGTGSQSYTIVPGAIQANWYFFDISGAVQGDVFTLATSSIGPATTAKPTIGGVTLDVVPEPSGLALFSLGAGLLLVRRRRV